MQRYDLVGEYDFEMAPIEHGTYVLYAECSDGCTCGDGWNHKKAVDALNILA